MSKRSCFWNILVGRWNAESLTRCAWNTTVNPMLPTLRRCASQKLQTHGWAFDMEIKRGKSDCSRVDRYWHAQNDHVQVSFCLKTEYNENSRLRQWWNNSSNYKIPKERRPHFEFLKFFGMEWHGLNAAILLIPWDSAQGFLRWALNLHGGRAEAQPELFEFWKE